MTEAQKKAEEILKEFGDREWVHAPVGMGKAKVFGYSNSKPIKYVKGIIEELEILSSAMASVFGKGIIDHRIEFWNDVLEELEG